MPIGIPRSKLILVDRYSFQEAPGKVLAARIPYHSLLLIVSVKQGGVDVYAGNYDAGSLPLAPHMHFGQTNAPVWIPIPEVWQELTLVSFGPANPVLASVMVAGMVYE